MGMMKERNTEFDKYLLPEEKNCKVREISEETACRVTTQVSLESRCQAVTAVIQAVTQVSPEPHWCS